MNSMDISLHVGDTMSWEMADILYDQDLLCGIQYVRCEYEKSDIRRHDVGSVPT